MASSDANLQKSFLLYLYKRPSLEACGVILVWDLWHSGGDNM
jgi:hypothetical protein